MENNEALFEQVTAPQEAVLDARVSQAEWKLFVCMLSFFFFS